MMISERADHYQVLGVDSNATADELRTARNARAMVFHPDRLRGAPDATRHWAEEELKKVNAAFAVLSDPTRRREYEFRRVNDIRLPSAPSRNLSSGLTNPEREQLVIYAREVGEHYQEERRLRKQLEESNRQLMKMLQLGAEVNKTFQEQLSDRMSYIYERDAIADELESFADQVQTMTEESHQNSAMDSGKLALRARATAKRLRQRSGV